MALVAKGITELSDKIISMTVVHVAIMLTAHCE